MVSDLAGAPRFYNVFLGTDRELTIQAGARWNGVDLRFITRGFD